MYIWYAFACHVNIQHAYHKKDEVTLHYLNYMKKPGRFIHQKEPILVVDFMMAHILDDIKDQVVG